MNQLFIKSSLVLVLISLAPQPAIGGEWGVGAAVAVQSIPQTGVEHEHLGAPYLTYEGDRLTVDLASVSYSLYETGTIKVDLLGELRFDGYEAQDSPALAGMATRDAAFDAGLRFSHRSDLGLLRLAVLADISGTHEGLEARVVYERPYSAAGWTFVPAVGVSWLDESLVDYYYGVRLDESADTRPDYRGRETSSVFAELFVSRSLGSRFELSAGIKHVRLGEAIADSPIVDDDHQTIVITSLLYKFQ